MYPVESLPPREGKEKTKWFQKICKEGIYESVGDRWIGGWMMPKKK
jgi:hypothetical protein